MLGSSAEVALNILQPLLQEPKKLRRYRNFAIHKREPRIEIYGVASHHDWSYMVGSIRAELRKQSPDAEMRKVIADSCKYRGVTYRKLKQVENYRLFDYAETCSGNQSRTQDCVLGRFRHCAVSCPTPVISLPRLSAVPFHRAGVVDTISAFPDGALIPANIPPIEEGLVSLQGLSLHLAGHDPRLASRRTVREIVL